MNVKYDWEELRRKFITGDYTTIKEFAEKEKVPYSLTRKHSANWLNEKRTVRQYKEKRIIENVINKQIVSTSYINERHIAVFEKALDIAERGLSECIADENINASRLEKIVDSLQKIQKAQRLALGMDKDGGNQAAEDNVTKLFANMKKAFEDEAEDS